MTEDLRNEVIDAYIDIVKRTGTKPTTADFAELDINRDKILRRFGGMDPLHNYMRENHLDILNSYYATVEDIFHKDRNANLSQKKRFVVTTAVAEAEAHLGFLDAINHYCDVNDAQIIIMPAESITNSFEKKTATFDKAFNDSKYFFVQEDTPLNDNISLCNIQVSAKQIKPITGLARIGNREGSYVFAAPKQFLEYTPSGNNRGKNFSIMTPGACTLPNYYTETFMSKRLSYIADFDHTMGAIIIEVQDDKIFHFRQIQCNEKGDFIDLGVMYTSEGTHSNVPVNIVFGDLHGINVDQEALDGFINLIREKCMSVDRVYLHDIFDGYSISHHVRDIAEMQKRSIHGKNNLGRELEETFELVAHIDHAILPREINIVKSNHDEFLSRYLASGRFVEDQENHYLSLCIATAQFENEDVLKRGFEVVGCEIPEHWTFLQRDDTSVIGGVECASHGDLGLNGAKASLNGLERVYGDCIIGHNHSAAIQRGVFRVGTLTKLDMGYNRGPSSWTQTSCLIYENGQRQLINCIGGKCAL